MLVRENPGWINLSATARDCQDVTDKRGAVEHANLLAFVGRKASGEEAPGPVVGRTLGIGRCRRCGSYGSQFIVVSREDGIGLVPGCDRWSGLERLRAGDCGLGCSRRFTLAGQV